MAGLPCLRALTGHASSPLGNVKKRKDLPIVKLIAELAAKSNGQRAVFGQRAGRLIS